MTDPIVVQSTANILFEGFDREAPAIVRQLANDCRRTGDDERAEMWARVAAEIETLTRRRLH